MRTKLTMNQQLNKAVRLCGSTGLVIGVNNRNGAFIIDTADNIKAKEKRGFFKRLLRLK